MASSNVISGDIAREQIAERIQRLDEELHNVRKRMSASEADTERDDSLFEDDGLYPSTDPFACLCWCQFKRIGHNYILQEKCHVGDDGSLDRELIIVGPHWIGVIVTASIIFVSTFFFVKKQCTKMPWYYTVITALFCWTTCYYLFQTACKDPGIVFPRRAKEEEERGRKGEHGDEGGATPLMEYTSTRTVRSNGETRCFCDICGIEQARFTEHCEDCGVCIEDYDHHCPWMGKCIGKGNMAAFKRFNCAWISYVAYVLWISIMNVDWSTVAVQSFHRASSGEWTTAT